MNRVKNRTQVFLILISFLSALLLSTTARAQIDINANNSNIIRVGGDVNVVANQVVQNAHAIGGSVTVQPGGRVTETAIAIGGNVVLKQNARVDGDAYTVGGKIIQEQGATIGGAAGTLPGDVQYNRRRWGYGGILSPMYFFNVAFHLLTILLSAAVGVLLLRWKPDFLPNLAAMIAQYPGRTGLWGLAGVFAVIALNIFLAISLIGIPLIPLVILATSIVTLLGSLGVEVFIGQRILAARTPIQQFLLGLLIVGLIGLIPVVRGLFLLVVNIFGLGAILTWQFSKVKPQTMG